jgi:hypothetical protein
VEFDDLEPGELTVLSNAVTGMVEIAISDADFELVLSRPEVFDFIAKLIGAQCRLDRAADRARVHPHWLTSSPGPGSVQGPRPS